MNMQGVAATASVAPVSTTGAIPISVMPSYPGPSVPATATRVAPVAEVPVHSTMTSSLPPSFESVTSAQHMPLPPVPAASTTPSSVAQSASTTTSATEEQLYIEKLNQLSKYINPVKRMLNRMSRDKRSPREIQKLRSLLEILENPLKKVTLSVLETCETVLGRLINEGPVASPPVVPTSTTAPVTKAPVTGPAPPAGSKGGAQQVFPLWKTVARVSESSTLAHNMQMSFNTALRTVHGPVIRRHAADEPFPEERLPKKKCPNSDSELPHILEKELKQIRKGGRFNVEVTPLSHDTMAMTGRTLSFSMVSSPAVPHIDVQIPNDYPNHCPRLLPLKTPTVERQSTVYGMLQSQMRNLPGRFTLTQLLRAWELSVNFVHGTQQQQQVQVESHFA
jgi:mediator of RNA polymerase II transcription subunit 15